MKISPDLLTAYNNARRCGNKKTFCHAPSSSLYFGINGHISACCYNRKNIFGKYPESTLQQIWESANAEKMRDLMTEGILPSGCNLCSDQLIAKNFRGLLASNFDQFAPPVGNKKRILNLFNPKKAGLLPSLMQFELSNTCNLECIMCDGFFSSSIRKNREKLPALPMVYDAAFTQQLVPFIPHLKEAKFLGGEPFLVDIYYDIWEEFIKHNPRCKVSITTNGTVLNNRVKRVLDKLNCQIVISIDSLTKTTYESIRQNANFDRVFENIQYFQKINKSNKSVISFAVCPMVTNWHEIPNMVNYANNNHIILYFNTLVSPRELSLKYLRLNELEHIFNVLQTEIAALPIAKDKIARNNLRTANDFCNQLAFWIKDMENMRESVMSRAIKQHLETSNYDDASIRVALYKIIMLQLLSPDDIKGMLGLLGQGDFMQNINEYFTTLWNLVTIFKNNHYLDKATDNQQYLAEFLALTETMLSDAEKEELCNILQAHHPLSVTELFTDNTPQGAVNEMRKYIIIPV